MMKKSLIMFFVLLIVSGLNAQDSTLGKLFRSSYHVWELQRNGIGVYRDSKLFAGADYHPSSVANVGIGLISLCIADSMGWDANAELKALTTLKSMTGHTPGFKPERNASGFYRHFIDMNTGARAWDSEFSTIDTEILMAAALFAKNYFRNDSISKYALEMWNSIQHEKAIADAANGKIYLTMNANGNGNPGSVTSVYNEYMIVAWMAKNATENTSSPAHILWNKFYADPDKLPFTNYGANRVLTDYPGEFLSSFTHQFNYYLCHYFSTSAKYLDYYIQALNADMAWWKTISNAAEWEWGCRCRYRGPNGYNADKINGNSTRTVSPHIIAGFLPVYPEAENHLASNVAKQKREICFSAVFKRYHFVALQFALIQHGKRLKFRELIIQPCFSDWQLCLSFSERSFSPGTTIFLKFQQPVKLKFKTLQRRLFLKIRLGIRLNLLLLNRLIHLLKYKF
jgi:hypothetical protein